MHMAYRQEHTCTITVEKIKLKLRFSQSRNGLTREMDLVGVLDLP